MVIMHSLKMKAESLCATIMEDILDADDSLSEMRNKREVSSTEPLIEMLCKGQLCNDIHERFENYKFESLDVTMISHHCHKNVDGTSGNSSREIHKSNTFPKQKNRTDFRRLRRKSVVSLPDIISSPPYIRRVNDSFSDTSSVFSDETSDTRLAHSYGISKYGPGTSSDHLMEDAHRRDPKHIEIYKAASACVQHPLMTDESFIPGASDQTIPQSKNLRLSSYLRHIFSNISQRRHHSYQRAQVPACENEKEFWHRKLQLHLFNELRVVERNEHPYYKESQFLIQEEYKLWQQNECRIIHQLMDQNMPVNVDSLDNEFPRKNRYIDYEYLLDKVIEYEHGSNMNLRTETVPSAMSENNIPESTASLSDLKDCFISLKARQLMQQFSLRYRLTPVTQCVAMMQCIKLNKEKGNLNIGDSLVLQESLAQMKHLFNILEEGIYFILNCEIESMISVTDDIIYELKHLMCSFLSQWRPSKKQLTDALALLDICYHFKRIYHVVGVEDHPACIRDWFIAAVRDDYAQHCCYKCGCKHACSDSRYIVLLRGVAHAIHTVKHGCGEGYQAIFSPYVDDVSQITAAILYESVIKGAEGLDVILNNSSTSDMDFRSSIILASKLSEFESCVLETGFRPLCDESYTSWRGVFHKHCMIWMDVISKQMTAYVMGCIRHDEYAVIKAQCQVSHSLHSTDDNSDLNYDDNAVIITRVEKSDNVVRGSEVNSSSTSACNNEKNEIQDRIRLNTMVNGSDNFPLSKEESTFTSNNHSDSYKVQHDMPLDKSSTSSNNSYHDNSSARCTMDSEAGTTAATTKHTFFCTHSIIDFVVLLNRFHKFTVDVANAIYYLPRFIHQSSAAIFTVDKQKEKFISKVFERISNVVEQYCDCMLNLDTCVFPQIDLKDFITRKKLKQLFRRARNGSVDCCRHQLVGKTECNDGVNERNKFKKNGVYVKMAHRINNVLLLQQALHVFWYRLASAFGIQHGRKCSITSSQSSIASVSSKSTLSSGTLNADNDSMDIDNKAIYNNHEDDGTDTQTNHIDGANKDGGCTTDDVITTQNLCEILSGASSIQFSGDRPSCENNIKGCHVPGTSFNTQRMQESLKWSQQHRRSDVSVVHNAGASFTRSCDHTTYRRPPLHQRTRSSTVGVSPATYHTLPDMLLQKILDDTSTGTTVRSLCGVFSWRVTQNIIHSFTKVLNTSSCSIKISFENTLSDIEACEKHCRPLSILLKQTLNHLCRWLHPDALSISHQVIWNVLIKNFKKKVETLNEFLDEARVSSFFLLVMFRFILKIFDSYGILSVNTMTEDLQPSLSLLELFIMPTKIVTNLYDDFDDHVLRHTSHGDVPLHLVRKLYRQQKSYSGRKLLSIIISVMGFNKNKESDRAEALKLCRKLFDRNMIKLKFVKNAKRNHLPELVVCENSLTCSMESDTSIAKKRFGRSYSSGTATSSALSSFSGSDTDSDGAISTTSEFVADNFHIYGLDFQAPNIHFYHFNNPNGGDLQIDDVRDVLLARRHHDATARQFLRNKNLTKRWSLFCSCFP